MRLLITRLFAIGLFGLPMIAVADPIVTYAIGVSPSSISGFSASWLHDADACSSAGPNTDELLYKCSTQSVNDNQSLTGSLSGTLSGGILTGITGSLSTGSATYSITGGRLGGDFASSTGTVSFSELLWYIQIDGLGTFYFENIGTSPNSFSAESLVLWGQNADAYNIASDCEPTYVANSNGDGGSFTDCGNRRGIDLFGLGTTTVPEPATLALLGLGLFGMGLARRRKTT